MKFWTAYILILVMAAVAVAAPGAGAEDKGKSIVLPIVAVEIKPGDGKNKVEVRCGGCHSLDYITTQPVFTRTQWTATVKKMINVMGAQIGEGDSKEIVDYLVRSYGTGE